MGAVSPARSKRPKTPELIIDVAERLWGQRGLDAVSLREISVAAGLANPGSVQYHFGGRDALVSAIYARRLPGIDARRRELLEAARAKDGAPGMRALLDCLFRPLLEQGDESGRHSYASFLRQVLQFAPAIALRGQAMDLTPTTVELVAAIETEMPMIPHHLAQHRLMAANFLMLDVLVKADGTVSPAISTKLAFEDALDMLAVALVQPSSDHTNEILKLK